MVLAIFSLWLGIQFCILLWSSKPCKLKCKWINKLFRKVETEKSSYLPIWPPIRPKTPALAPSISWWIGNDAATILNSTLEKYKIPTRSLGFLPCWIDSSSAPKKNVLSGPNKFLLESFSYQKIVEVLSWLLSEEVHGGQMHELRISKPQILGMIWRSLHHGMDVCMDKLSGLWIGNHNNDSIFQFDLLHLWWIGLKTQLRWMISMVSVTNFFYRILAFVEWSKSSIHPVWLFHFHHSRSLLLVSHNFLESPFLVWTLLLTVIKKKKWFYSAF